ncbi:gamma-glutamyltransferase family protein [Candidatus Entotheonella palauensis]|uniref:gamma-glutamyltransferase family protein n=1 Tax=Candidatus Entotheonella palauensis TaxID=93172 RepID=UPI0015C44897|nr:gamma-glutamyltransferase family protein [Candidatus Entotheonella palauensis]
MGATAVCADTADYSRTKTVKGNRYMIAAANPMATEAGCEILRAGGNAIDAAIATQMVLAVVEPHASGLAGGTMTTYWDNTTKQVRFFDGLSRAPQAVTAGLRTPTEQDQIDCGTDRFLGRVSNTGRAFGVPGTLRVLEMVHNEYGNKPWRSLFEAGVHLADNGFEMPQYLHTVLGETAVARIPRCAFPDIQSRYCHDDSTPKAAGTVIFNPELATTLRTVRDGGANTFYDPQGTIAPQIIARATAGPCMYNSEPAVIPSLMTVADIASYQAVERMPICDDVLGRTVCTSAPPAFGGTAMLYMLNLMERGNIQHMAHNSLEAVHLFIESSRLAQIDRRNYIGDPDFNPIPVAGLLDDTYLDERFALISPHQAINPVVWGVPPGAEGLPWSGGGTTEEDAADMTSHISIVDQFGNALSMTTTNNSTFGAHIEAAGMILNNVQNNFTRLDSISPGKPVNVMQSQKRPRTSIAPTLVFDSQGRVEFVVGAAGGSAIPDYIAQTLLGVFAYGKNSQIAINRPHMSGQWITSSNGVRQLRSELEEGRGIAKWLDELQAMGHPAARTTKLRSGLAAVQIKYRKNGRIRLFGAADRRRDGVAMGN